MASLYCILSDGIRRFGCFFECYYSCSTNRDQHGQANSRASCVAHPVLWTQLCLRCDGLLKVLAPGLSWRTVPQFGDEPLLVVFFDEVPDCDTHLFFGANEKLPTPARQKLTISSASR